MKKIIALLLALSMLVSLTACVKPSGDNSSEGSGNNTAPVSQSGGNSAQVSQSSEGDSIQTSDGNAGGQSQAQEVIDNDYEFEHVGLSGDVAKMLEKIEDLGPGVYYYSLYDGFDSSRDDAVYLCSNGDKLVLKADTGNLVVFTAAEGYVEYDLNYSGDNYSIIDYVDHLKEFYAAEYSALGPYFYFDAMVNKVPDSTVYESYRDIVNMRARALIGPYDMIPEDETPAGLWPLSYKRYASDGMRDHLNTQYMPKRNISYLDPVLDKVYAWEITYSIPEVYNTDYIFRVEFTDDITLADMDGIASRISAMMEQEFTGYNGTYSGNFIIYTCIEGEEKDELSDSYELIFLNGIGADFGLHSSLVATYLNSEWIDGGSFCTYKFKKDGLHRKKNIEPYTDAVIVPAG